MVNICISAWLLALFDKRAKVQNQAVTCNQFKGNKSKKKKKNLNEKYIFNLNVSLELTKNYIKILLQQ